MKPTNEDPNIAILRFIVNVVCLIVMIVATIIVLNIPSKPPPKEQRTKHENKAVKIDSNNYKPKNKK